MGERALRVLFAPNCASQLPHLSPANCGVVRLFGTKITSQNPLAGNAGNACNPCDPCDPWFFPRVPRITRVTGKTGEFESRLFSGRCEALQRRVADEMVAHSNLFESGLAVRLLHYLRKIATPHRKGYTKSFWFRFCARVALLCWEY